ncbi:MAG: polysaccharide deacetylase family protein [Myxococcaceae bacterium]
MRGLFALLLFASCASVPRVQPGFDVALTVDDLPAHGPFVGEQTRLQIAQRFIEVLQAHGVRGVHGFTNGSRVDAGTEEVLRAWVRAGHHLSNHTWSHPSLNKLTAEEFLADAVQNEPLLARFEPDADARLFFRYPFLYEGDVAEKRDTVRKELFARGFRLAHVSIDGDDWAFNQPFARCTARKDREQLAELRRLFIAVHLDELQRMRKAMTAMTGREVPQVLLLHIGAGDAEFLDDLMRAFEKAGARWVGLRQALDDPFYAQDPGVVQKAGAAFPYRVAKAQGVTIDAPIYARGLEERLEATCP